MYVCMLVCSLTIYILLDILEAIVTSLHLGINASDMEN